MDETQHTSSAGHTDYRRTLLISLGVLMFLVVVIAVGLRSYFRWAERSYFGEIIMVHDSSFLMRGGDGMEMLVMITPDTMIRRGRATLEDGLQVGASVIVIGSRTREGHLEAKLIRVVTGDRRDDAQRPPRLPFFR